MIVGLYGESRSGKDSVAKILQEHCGYEWRIMADNIRKFLLRVDPFILELKMHLTTAVDFMGWDSVKEKAPSVVDQMIGLGQVARDIIGEEVWLSLVLTPPLPKKLVISDVRQANEYETIKSLGGQIWHVVREGSITRGMDNLLDPNTYPVDVVVYNNGTLANLQDRVISLEGFWCGRR